MKFHPVVRSKEDELLPQPASGLATIAAGSTSVLLVGMIVAGVLGGVAWLASVGAAGTALGTLGLAFFTFAVAKRTTELADSSQRLERATVEEIREGKKQAAASETMAREAQKARIDALAPIVDLDAKWEGVKYQPLGVTPAPLQALAQDAINHASVDQLRFTGALRLVLTNLGRTPAFVRVKHAGLPIIGSPPMVRVDPGAAEAKDLYAELDYSGPNESPFDQRDVCFEFTVVGAMTMQTIDRIVWEAEITALEWAGNGWRSHPAPVRAFRYKVDRRHGI